MDKKNRSSNIGPILVLYVLSPLIAELLFGSTPVSRGSQLIFESLFYGSGALLIREFARRNKLGWPSIITLGIAFGIIEECLLLQSAFNPHFLGNDLTFGRILGVNLVWSEFMIGYHAIWSITIPILFSELLFAKKSNEPWLNKISIGIFSILFILSSVAIYVVLKKMSGSTTSAINYSIAGFLVLGSIVFSLFMPLNIRAKRNFKIPPSFFVGVVAFIGSAFWLLLFSLVFKHDAGYYSWIVELSGVIIVLSLSFLISVWSKQNWNDTHRFYLASGGLLASMLFGLLNLMQANNKLDQVCQMVLIIITIILLMLLKKRLLVGAEEIGSRL